MKQVLAIPLGLMLALAAGLVHAATVGDAKAGETKAQPCAACHGANGISTAPQFPNLAGQVPGYISSQLAKFKSGDRANPIMKGMAAGLSEQDMADVDAYFSSLPPKEGAVPEDKAASAERGGELFRGGDKSMRIAACMGCHGPSGAGIPTRFPRLAGQKQAYVVTQLQAFKKGDRESDGGIMNDIAFLMTQKQMDDVASFIHALK
ncbi:MAG: c-type cytochrome [Arenicellales bacterium]